MYLSSRVHLQRVNGADFGLAPTAISTPIAFEHMIGEVLAELQTCCFRLWLFEMRGLDLDVEVIVLRDS